MEFKASVKSCGLRRIRVPVSGDGAGPGWQQGRQQALSLGQRGRRCTGGVGFLGRLYKLPCEAAWVDSMFKVDCMVVSCGVVSCIHIYTQYILYFVMDIILEHNRNHLAV